jgi:hypothetical protein
VTPQPLDHTVLMIRLLGRKNSIKLADERPEDG